MNARQSFYSSVFDTINSYKRKDEEKTSHGFIGDHLIELGIFSAVLLFSVTTGFAYTFPQYMTFSRHNQNATIATTSLFNADESHAAEPPQMHEIRLSPVSDTYVSASTPQSVYGDQLILRAQAKPRADIVLTYKVPAISKILHASFALPSLKKNTGEVDVFAIPNTAINESSLNFSSEPTQNASLAGQVSDLREPAQIDLNDFVQSDSFITILVRARTGSVAFAAKEAPVPASPVIVIGY